MKTLYGILLVLAVSVTQAQTVSTLAGVAGAVGSNDGPAATATFNNPHGVACDKQGNIYIANRYGHTIRKITPGGIVSTLAGSGIPGATDGTGTAASFNEPWAVACDTLGNVYVADTKNYKIRRISSTGVVTTVAGTGISGVTNGPNNAAQFSFPAGIAVNRAGTLIYVSDRMSHVIRKINAGTVSNFAGSVYNPGNNNGTGTAAKFDHPYSIALDAAGNILVADEYNNTIRKITSAGVVTTLAGDGSQGSQNGSAATASFNAPWGICLDVNGDIYVGDGNNFLVRKISAGTVSTYAGMDGIAGNLNGPAAQSTFNGVSSVAYNASMNSIIACDPFSQLVRKITVGAVQTLTLSTQSGAMSFCSGNTVTLVAAPTNFSNYVFKEGTTTLGTSSNGTLNISSLSIGSHTITCSATNTQGNTIYSNPITITITSGLSVSIIANGTTTICNGDTVILSSSTPGTYLWSTGATTASIIVTTTGTYSLTVSNSQGCSGQATPVTVNTLTAPAATITSSTSLPVCHGDSILLTSSSASSFMWSNGATSQQVYVTNPGNYTVMVTNGAGCSAISLPMTVNFFPSTTSTTSPSGNILLVQGSSVTITANSGNGYQWSNGSTTQSISVTNPGTYTVTVTDGNGCPSTPAVASVNLVTSSNIVSVGGPTTFCEGDSVVLTSVFNTGNQWYKNGTVISGATQKVYIARFSGFYQLQVTPPGSSPVLSDSIEVIIKTVPNSVTTEADTVCKGESAVISALPQAGVSYKWYDTASGGSPLGTGLSYTTTPILQNKSYYVELINSFGCVRANRFEVMVMMNPQPNSDFNNSGAVPVSGGYEVVFNNTSTQAINYFWDFGDPSSSQNNSSDAQPSHTYSQPGNYIVSLVSTNSYGCVDSLAKTVSVTLNNNIYIPTGFTPNGDGNNDVFRVRGNNIRYSEMSLYNQWGQKIWYSEKETTGWDGRMNGEPVPNGTYVYVIKVNFDSGTTETYKGNISVIR